MCRELATTAFALALTFVATAGIAEEVGQNTFRVCADPNNLPFSNREREGFENKLAELVAQKLGLSVSYTWWAQRRGFIRNTLKAKDCDVVMGVPAHYDPVETTAPYYRSSYVFVTRADRKLNITSLEDPLLNTLKIGVHLIGDDGNNTPPAHVLGQQGMTQNVIGFMIYGDYREPSPPARLIEAVEKGEVDIAAAWGPLAGYTAKHSAVPLTVSLIHDDGRFAPLRLQFDIAMGVRHGDHALREKLDRVMAESRQEIDALLRSYGVPLVNKPVVADKKE
jgi:mxaJ protein